jgi:hypothetical protein
MSPRRYFSNVLRLRKNVLRKLSIELFGGLWDIATPNHVFAKNGVFLEVCRVFGEKKMLNFCQVLGKIIYTEVLDYIIWNRRSDYIIRAKGVSKRKKHRAREKSIGWKRNSLLSLLLSLLVYFLLWLPYYMD